MWTYNFFFFGTRVSLEFFQGTRVLHMEREFMELEFQIKKKKKIQFAITRLSKNRVSKQEHFPK